MENHFAALGLPEDPDLTEDDLRAAFREAGRTAHPDAGGGDGDFARIQRAFDLLTSPSKRLGHWLELKGHPVDLRGAVDPGLMDLFSRVGEVSQAAEAVARKRSAAKSALVLALLETETQQAIESVEATISVLDGAIAGETGAFSRLAAGGVIDAEALVRMVRKLAFLEKWRASMRGLIPKLV